VPHVDPERLTLLALGEAAVDEAESSHVEQCPTCRVDLDALRTVAGHARHGQELADQPAPSEQVWQRIAAATGVAERQPETAAADAGPAVPRQASTGNRPAPADGRLVRRRRGWVRGFAVATAAAAIAVVATLVGIRVFGSPATEPPERVAATAQLAPEPIAPAGSRGVARVLGAGERLELQVTGLPAVSGYYEVWLIDPETSQMVSVGLLRGDGDELLPLPSNIDLRRYRLVDVSAEEFDGNVAHSGRSLLRGTLVA
jgi:hypothetical protein